MEITLKSGRTIGDGYPTYIIAEVGSNWGTLDDCLLSIRQAKNVGADAVKFQAYDAKSLYGIDREGALKAIGTLPLDWLPKLKAEADRVGIDFMCTAFSPELVAAVDPHVDAHKVASAELTHLRLLEAIAKTGKPVFLSTGASGTHDIVNALEALNGVPVVLLYCVAAYPARRINLNRMATLGGLFKRLVGYSDHSTDVIEIPRRAAELGACVIEKHVTFIEADTPDSPHSLDSDQFRRMVDAIRKAPASENPALGATEEERGMALRHKRRLIATRDIAEGEAVLEGVNFGIYRSLKDDTHAFSPWLIDKVNGKTAKRAVKAGDGVGPGDV